MADGSGKTHGNRNGSKWIRKERRSQIYLRDERACLCCGAKENLTLDHYVPRCHGGTHRSSNLITLCLACNCFKGDNTPREWFARLRQRFASFELFSAFRARIERHRRRTLKPPTLMGSPISDEIIDRVSASTGMSGEEIRHNINLLVSMPITPTGELMSKLIESAIKANNEKISMKRREEMEIEMGRAERRLKKGRY